MYGVEVDELQDKFNDAAREMNRGNDVLLSLGGQRNLPRFSGF